MTYETVGGYPASPDIDLDVPEICEKCDRDCPEPCEALKRLVTVETLYYSKPDMDAFHEKLKAKITQLNECLGEYESKEWCDHCIIDSKCAQITLHVQELKEKAKKYDAINWNAIRATVNEKIEAEEKIDAVETAFEAHRENLIELSGNLTQIAHESELPEEYHYAIEKIATNMISYGELRKILEESRK